MKFAWRPSSRSPRSPRSLKCSSLRSLFVSVFSGPRERRVVTALDVACADRNSRGDADCKRYRRPRSNQWKKPYDRKSNQKRNDSRNDWRSAFLRAVDVTQAIADKSPRATVSQHHRRNGDEKRNHTEHGHLLVEVPTAFGGWKFRRNIVISIMAGNLADNEQAVVHIRTRRGEAPPVEIDANIA